MFIRKKKSQYHGAFISEIDKHLVEFDRTHDWSKTQAAERRKYGRIFKLRNEPIKSKEEKTIWDF
ncbi:CBU_0585 family protein [Coxiella endosymbiont of Amblyomma nuttalli]|uniref:CBU_0585 family protein n=1 Tax=Coxiella endosymbiont of Amblyomma nuttalli TaxID=2749996 RepID=UPI001BAD39A2|nr:CBU_0585 family protein [Coxiella endosymbiont of Amblyomma nuttalli]QTS83897.1 hypothetical protein CEAn_00375 [Coxiella endosymbiont of Amblyomma nuttalli]